MGNKTYKVIKYGSLNPAIEAGDYITLEELEEPKDVTHRFCKTCKKPLEEPKEQSLAQKMAHKHPLPTNRASELAEIAKAHYLERFDKAKTKEYTGEFWLELEQNIFGDTP